MTRARFIVFMLMIGVYMPGCLAAWIYFLHVKNPLVPVDWAWGYFGFLYLVFTPLIVFNFWTEFDNLFAGKDKV